MVEPVSEWLVAVVTAVEAERQLEEVDMVSVASTVDSRPISTRLSRREATSCYVVWPFS